jgi:hypothetical protein
MFPLWDVAIAPVLHAAGAAGSSRSARCGARPPCGCSTTPAPTLAPRHRPRHRSSTPQNTSGRSPAATRSTGGSASRSSPPGPVDAALIDGDHNWYTVYNELRLLAEGARRHGTDLPVLTLHDVGWPYGRLSLLTAKRCQPRASAAELRDPVRVAHDAYRTSASRPRDPTTAPLPHSCPTRRWARASSTHLEASLDAGPGDGEARADLQSRWLSAPSG